MGNKISWEDAEKLASPKENDESIILPPNKYGYRVNISHPKIKPLYDKFKRKRKAMILSDKERFAFELLIHQLIQDGRIKQ